MCAVIGLESHEIVGRNFHLTQPLIVLFASSILSISLFSAASPYAAHSHRFNYKVNEVFRELMGCTGGIGGFHLAGMNFSQSHDKDKCTIL